VNWYKSKMNETSDSLRTDEIESAILRLSAILAEIACSSGPSASNDDKESDRVPVFQPSSSKRIPDEPAIPDSPNCVTEKENLRSKGLDKRK